MVYRGDVKGGVVVLDAKVDLPEGAEVKVEPLLPPSGKTLAERLGDLIGSVPDLPSDMADQHDHYLHGRPSDERRAHQPQRCVYYLQAGKTRTGKPRYWFGRKLTGERVQSVPAGYEIYEQPETGQVSLRKPKPTEISELERDIVADGLRRDAGLEHFIVDVQDNSLVVYLPGMSERAADRLLNVLAGPFSAMSPRVQECKAQLMKTSDYTKMMRFLLVNAEERVFAVQRWCFRGSVDDWIWVGGPARLDALVREYGRHLGKESFYEMM